MLKRGHINKPGLFDPASLIKTGRIKNPQL